MVTSTVEFLTSNVGGSEWVIIIFVAMVLILGTNKLPDFAKKLGKAVGEYNKTKSTFQNQLGGISDTGIEITGPVQNERQKLEVMAKTLGTDVSNKTDEELKKIITSKIEEGDLANSKKSN